LWFMVNVVMKIVWYIVKTLENAVVNNKHLIEVYVIIILLQVQPLYRD